MRKSLILLSVALLSFCGVKFDAGAQVYIEWNGTTDTVATAPVDSMGFPVSASSHVDSMKITEIIPVNRNGKIESDTLIETISNRIFVLDSIEVDTTIDVSKLIIPEYVYLLPPVYTNFYQLDTVSPLKKDLSDKGHLDWIDKEVYRLEATKRLRQDFYIKHPDLVPYNLASLPEPPKQYIAVADPEKAIIVIQEVDVKLREEDTKITSETKEYHWLNNFNGSIQFSQAYNSPNWYQGGNSHLNLLVNLLYNIKLNQAYHPNLMFDTSIQYKLALNSAPDDTLRNYNISEDLFQINSKFGVKAAKHWFYTLTLQFKTQFLNNYQTNTNNLTAAFLSPGELNAGLGMTYNYVNPKKTVTFDLSINPASYNLKTCINKKMNVTLFDIEPGRKTVSQYGSSLEATLTWKMCYNITYSTRLFAFTDYDYFQGDWENTFDFSINRFLTTKLYIHLRYDSSTPQEPGTKWHYWQLREILSFGFAYKFATA